MSQLLVTLPLAAPSAATEWAYVLSPDGRQLASQGKAAASLLPQPRGAGAEVVAVVPAQALAWHRVELPRGLTAGSPRLRQALEGLLEEQLLDEPEALHLALQPGAKPGETAWVASCDRNWLREALARLEAAGRPADRIVPEFAPEGEAGLHVIGEPEQALLVFHGPDGVLALPATAAALPLLPALPDEAPRLAEPAVAALAEQLLQRPPQLQQAPQRWLQAAQGGWDLAQFDFASSSRTRALKKVATGWSTLLSAPQWRPARWGAVLLLAVNLLGLNAWAWKERSALEEKRGAVRATLQQTFPQVRVIVDAPVQMQREVASLRQQTGVASRADLESQLAVLAAAVPAGRSPTSLQYNGSELRVGGLGLDSGQVQTVVATLRSQGYAVVTQGGSLIITAEDGR